MLLYFLGELILIGNIANAYENLAIYKPTWQQHPYNAYYWKTRSDNAVDGLFSDRSLDGRQCTISDNKRQTATLWVNLGRILSIHQITVYYRTDNLPWDLTNGYPPRFLGFSIYISNTTNKDEGFLCFKDTNFTIDTIPDNITIECIQHGRYVIYYNERLPGVSYQDGYSQYAFNELCELEVYGCLTTGEYGENCSLTCPQNCQEGHCNIVDGTCLGCVVGFKGSQCEEECDNHRFGLECKYTCGNCSSGEQCNHVNGSCPNGCDVGAQGVSCEEPCPVGKHGKNCDEECSSNCKGCNRFNGVCEFGCYDGWKGTFCENECDGLMYGHNCNQSCGSCLKSEQCHHIYGTCLNGCDRGYQGENCTEECPDGYFGYGCQDTCSINCGVPGRCNRVTGQCESGCQAGWRDRKCDKKCDRGKFGLSCAQSCGSCVRKEQCHHVNGSCLNGCDKGYQGIQCIQECPDGRYGYNCEETCTNCSFIKRCDVISGQCNVIRRSLDSNTSDQIPSSLYGILSSLCLSFGLNIALIFWSCKKKACKEKNGLEKTTTHLSTEPTKLDKQLDYDVEDSVVYEDVDQLSHQSIYEN